MWQLSSRFILNGICSVYLVAWAVLAAGSIAPAQAVKASDPGIAFSVSFESFGKKPSGVVMIGWDDGVVAFAINPDLPGQELQVGRITPDQLKAVLSELKAADFFGSRFDPGRFPDNSCTTITARRDDERGSHTWNEALSRPWGAHAGADPKFKAFARMWAASRTSLAFAYPTNYQPLAKDPDTQKRFERARAVRWGTSRKD